MSTLRTNVSDHEIKTVIADAEETWYRAKDVIKFSRLQQHNPSYANQCADVYQDDVDDMKPQRS